MSGWTAKRVGVSTCITNSYVGGDIMCGPGKQTNTRTIIKQATNGGKACGPLSVKVSCNAVPCDHDGQHNLGSGQDKDQIGSQRGESRY